ncbi:hypothetical protein LVJ94_34940 [Pendulispora rubella]|uniref:Phage tail sheath protein n=1 Tax=Pendulispora rubella TaxID=2741070 RepID=A0ABZ2KWE5_9BACT
MAASIPRPGVEVLQTFRSVSPTVDVPALVPCCIGVCRQIVDALAQDGTPNREAVVPLHAQFTAAPALGTPAVYTGLDGFHLVVSLNSGPNLAIPFVGVQLTPAQVVAQVLAAFSGAGVSAYTAEVLGNTWRLRSVAANEFQNIHVIGPNPTGQAPNASDAEVLAIFQLGADRVYAGASFYTQRITNITLASFPDPRKNLSQLTFEASSVRAFLVLGGNAGLTEVRRDQTFLRQGLGSPASIVGTVDLTTLQYGAGGVLDKKTLVLNVNGVNPPLTITFAAPASASAALAQINAVIGAVANAVLDAGNRLVLQTIAIGPQSRLVLGAGSAHAVLGITGASAGGPALRAIDSGAASAVTPLVQAPGANFVAPATAASLVGTATLSMVPDGQTLAVDDGTGPQTLTFMGADSPLTILLQVNGMFGLAGGGLLTASMTAAQHLVLTNARLGIESQIQVLGGTALAALGLGVSSVRGSPYPVRSGDALYAGGTLVGTVTQPAPGGNADQLKLDRLIAVSPNVALSYYLLASGLPAPNRPTPDLLVDAAGNVTLKNDLVRDIQGTTSPVRTQIAIAYKAVRRDVSALGKNGGLLRYDDTTTLENELGPISPENPLALALYLALLNAPGTQVTGLGVDAASRAEPYGTVEAFVRAAEFLEAYEVYATAPLTHNTTVGQVFRAHVDAMSEPEQKGERITLFNPERPLSRVDRLVASGTGDSAAAPNTFDTSVANLSSLLLAMGITAVGAVAVAAGIYLNVGDGSRYAIVDVTGSRVTVKTAGFLPGENDDAFYAVTPLPGPLISHVFAVSVRGAPLVRLDGSPDKDAMALTYQQLAQGVLDRRFWQVIPDKCAVTLQGVEQQIEGFYVAAAVAGMIAAQPPQQSFTNFPITGFTRVIGSNGYFSEKQLDIVAGGGNIVIVQDAAGAPLTARMALTTDMTSVQTRTDSIVKAVDMMAKILRLGVRNFIGRFNISQGLLDSLSHVIQGLFDFAKAHEIILDANLNNLIQDADEPDRLLLDTTLEVAYPFNYLRVTIAI